MPGWWVELARTDLPDDPRVTPAAGAARTAVTPTQAARERALPPPPAAPPPAHHSASPVRSSRLRERLGNAVVLIMVVAAAILVTWVGMGDPSPRGIVVVTLVFGVPMGVTLAVVSVVNRRHRR